MTTEQLEQRLAAVERAVAELQRKATPPTVGPDPKSRWWESIPPMSEELQRAWDEMEPFRQYIRQTGESPPPEWRPGDPIPEPDHWK